MKNLLILLSILFILGILWIRSNFWSFSEETYINPQIVDKATSVKDRLDLNYLKTEFTSAYEF